MFSSPQYSQPLAWSLHVVGVQCVNEGVWKGLRKVRERPTDYYEIAQLSQIGKPPKVNGKLFGVSCLPVKKVGQWKKTGIYAAKEGGPLAGAPQRAPGPTTHHCPPRAVSSYLDPPSTAQHSSSPTHPVVLTRRYLGPVPRDTFAGRSSPKYSSLRCSAAILSRGLPLSGPHQRGLRVPPSTHPPALSPCSHPVFLVFLIHVKGLLARFASLPLLIRVSSCAECGVTSPTSHLFVPSTLFFI